MLGRKKENNNRFGSYCTNTDLINGTTQLEQLQLKYVPQTVTMSKAIFAPPFVNLVSKDSGRQTPIEQQMVFF